MCDWKAEMNLRTPKTLRVGGNQWKYFTSQRVARNGLKNNRFTAEVKMSDKRKDKQMRQVKRTRHINMPGMMRRNFTLIELLVVIAIITTT